MNWLEWLGVFIVVCSGMACVYNVIVGPFNALVLKVAILEQNHADMREQLEKHRKWLNNGIFNNGKE